MQAKKDFKLAQMLFNPQPLTFISLIRNAECAVFSARCCLTRHPLKLPLVNTECTPLCYMSAEAFFNKFKAHQNYECPRCKGKRTTTRVVYDPGFEYILGRQNMSKQQIVDELLIDSHGLVHKERIIEVDEALKKEVFSEQIALINRVREDKKNASTNTIVVEIQAIRTHMADFYKTLLNQITEVGPLLFCRGKIPERGGKNWINSIYLPLETGSMHLYFCKNRKQVSINAESEIHFVPEKKAFFILTSQNEELRMYRASVSNILGDKLELEETPFKLTPRQHFGVAHSSTHLYLVGGMIGNNTVSNEAFEISLEGNFSSRQLPKMINERAAVKAVYHNGRLFVVGGARRNPGFEAVDKSQYYDCKKGNWTAFSAPFKGYNLGVFSSQDNVIAIYGGSQDCNNTSQLNTYYLMDATNLSIKAKGTLIPKGIRLEFSHESAGAQSSVLRQENAQNNKFETIWKFTFLPNQDPKAEMIQMES